VDTLHIQYIPKTFSDFGQYQTEQLLKRSDSLIITSGCLQQGILSILPLPPSIYNHYIINWYQVLYNIIFNVKDFILCIEHLSIKATQNYLQKWWL